MGITEFEYYPNGDLIEHEAQFEHGHYSLKYGINYIYKTQYTKNLLLNICMLKYCISHTFNNNNIHGNMYLSGTYLPGW